MWATRQFSSFWTVSSLSLLFLVIETVKKKKKTSLFACEHNSWMTSVWVGVALFRIFQFWLSTVGVNGATSSLHLGMLPLYIICQDIIWNVNLFLQYTVSSESQLLLYIMHITVQVARKWCFFLFLHSGVSRVEQTRVITLNPAPQAA